MEGRSLIISGADIVDGSPVIDIKPYLPFCESLPSASAPTWVQVDTLSDAPPINAIGPITGYVPFFLGRSSPLWRVIHFHCSGA